MATNGRGVSGNAGRFCRREITARVPLLRPSRSGARLALLLGVASRVRSGHRTVRIELGTRNCGSVPGVPARCCHGRMRGRHGSTLPSLEQPRRRQPPVYAFQVGNREHGFAYLDSGRLRVVRSGNVRTALRRDSAHSRPGAQARSSRRPAATRSTRRPALSLCTYTSSANSCGAPPTRRA